MNEENELTTFLDSMCDVHRIFMFLSTEDRLYSRDLHLELCKVTRKVLPLI
jgi:hypothetical protein